MHIPDIPINSNEDFDELIRLIDSALEPAVERVMMCKLCQITPPFGLNLFAIHGISGRSFAEIVAGSTPFVFLMLIMIVLLALLPGMALWLPGLML